MLELVIFIKYCYLFVRHIPLNEKLKDLLFVIKQTIVNIDYFSLAVLGCSNLANDPIRSRYLCDIYNGQNNLKELQELVKWITVTLQYKHCHSCSFKHRK